MECGFTSLRINSQSRFPIETKTLHVRQVQVGACESDHRKNPCFQTTEDAGSCITFKYSSRGGNNILYGLVSKNNHDQRTPMWQEGTI